MIPSHYTDTEGGMWKRWPQGVAIDREDLQIIGVDIFIIMMNGERASTIKIKGLDVHSLVIDGVRWDCYSGWTPEISPNVKKDS